MNTTAHEVHYTDYHTQMAWINANDWQIERRAKRYPVWQAVAKALIALAGMFAPTTLREAQTA